LIVALVLMAALEVEPGAARVAALDSCPSPTSREDVPAGLPILCYHHVSAEPGMYSVSPRRLERDLMRLADEGFYLVTPEDLENGLMQVPAGRRPVMVTFDDGWRDNMFFVEDDPGRLDPHCALGVMERVSRRRPEMGRGAVFYLSWDKVPFGEEELVEEKLNRLLDLGYSIGNHTLYHASFSRLARDRWDRTVTGALELFRRNLGLRTAAVSSLSYPGGSLPKEAGAEEFMDALRDRGRKAVSFGVLVDGAVTSMRRMAETRLGRYRTSRIDMSRYSVEKLLRWPTLPGPGTGRQSLHDPLPYRMPPLGSGGRAG
jgi:peptidoglycan/xylan/chitin deacetylase (PgdA/CDA1 family)